MLDAAQGGFGTKGACLLGDTKGDVSSLTRASGAVIMTLPLEYGRSSAPAHPVEPWCRGLTCVPVKDEIAGSNPVGSA